MGWLIAVGAVAVGLWVAYWLWPRISAHYVDRRARIAAAARFAEQKPQRDDESDEEFRRAACGRC